MTTANRAPSLRIGGLGLLLLFSVPIRSWTSPGDLEFPLPTSYPSIGDGCQVVTADVNEDGCLDLVATNRGPGVVVHLGDGAGAFGPGTTFVAHPDGSSLSLACGDFTEDGHLDLVVLSTGHDDSRLDLLTGDGTGGFLRLASYLEGGIDLLICGGILASDLDDDQHLDLIVYQGTAVAILFGDGSGGFSSGPLLPMDRPRGIASADFDQDGNVDFAVAADPSLVFLGQGSGVFGPPVELGFGTVIHADDFDGDGLVDLLTGGSSNVVRLRLGNGDGSFGSPSQFDMGTREVLCPDLDHDGLPDLVGLFSPEPRLEVRLNRGGGKFSDAARFAGGPMQDCVAADFDGDGLTDVVGITSDRDGLDFDGNGRIYVVRGLGQDQLGAPDVPHELRSNNTSFGALTLGRFDGDDLDDLVLFQARNISPPSLLFLPGLGEGEFGDAVETVAAPSHSFRASRLFPMEFSSDENPCLLALSTTEGRTYAVDGQGRFTLSTTFPAGSNGKVGFGDFNEDGFVDLALPRPFADRVLFLPGDGKGNFGPWLQIDSLFEPQDLAIEDFNGDGHLDFALARVKTRDQREGRVTVYFGGGRLGFAVQQHVEVVRDPGSIVAGDFNEDGLVDLLVLSHSEQDPGTLLFGLESGIFEVVGSVPLVGSEPRVADFDRDGHLDVATLRDEPLHLISLYRGDGNGGFAPAHSIENPDGFASWFVFDSNTDGLLDLLGVRGRAFSYAVTVRNQSYRGCQLGNVNLGAGDREDVLLLNGRTGIGPRREIFLDRNEAFEISMASPSSMGGSAQFALYLWRGGLHFDDLQVLPFDLGSTCRPMPLSTPLPSENPLVVWKNIPGFETLLGTATRPSTPAPSVVESIPTGLGVGGTFCLQGIIRDKGSLLGQAAVTNGILLDVD